MHAQSLQSCPTLLDPMDCSLWGASVHEILQAKILKWVVMPSSRVSSWPRDWTCISCVSCIAGGFFTTEPLGKPVLYQRLVKTPGTIKSMQAFFHTLNIEFMVDFFFFYFFSQCRMPSSERKVYTLMSKVRIFQCSMKSTWRKAMIAISV